MSKRGVQCSLTKLSPAKVANSAKRALYLMRPFASRFADAGEPRYRSPPERGSASVGSLIISTQQRRDNAREHDDGRAEQSNQSE